MGKHLRCLGKHLGSNSARMLLRHHIANILRSRPSFLVRFIPIIFSSAPPSLTRGLISVSTRIVLVAASIVLTRVILVASPLLIALRILTRLGILGIRGIFRHVLERVLASLLVLGIGTGFVWRLSIRVLISKGLVLVV